MTVTAILVHASWCGACDQFKPVFQQAMHDYTGLVTPVMVNFDNHHREWAPWVKKVEALPTVFVLNGEGLVGKVEGVNEAKLVRLLNKAAAQ